jgi:inosine-uridine nucleoside N-ribohydrolase
MTKPQLLIDTDPGVDDALAILMAHAHADIAGLSIAAGNVGLGHTVRNARTLVDLLGARHAGVCRLRHAAGACTWKKMPRSCTVRMVLAMSVLPSRKHARNESAALACCA